MRIGKMIGTILQQDPLGVAGTPSGKNLREIITELTKKVGAKKQARKKPVWWGSLFSRMAKSKSIKKDRMAFDESASTIATSLRSRGYDEALIQEYIDTLAEYYGAEKLDISTISTDSKITKSVDYEREYK